MPGPPRFTTAPGDLARRVIGLLNLYIPEIDRSSGLLTVDVALGGTLGTPLVNGLVRLEDGELDLYNINLALRAANLEARLIDNGFSFKGSARSGEGSLAAFRSA